LIEPTLDTKLQIGEIVSIVGVLTASAIERLDDRALGPPVRDRELLHYQPESVQICVTRKDASGGTLGELQTPQTDASFVSRVTRLGVDLEMSSTTKLERGDVLYVTGPGAGLEALGARLGHFEREVEETDLRTFSWAIVLGILIGTWTLTIAGVSIGLGSAGGLLTVGLVVGYLRSILPVFGRVPWAARWIFTELGLLLFRKVLRMNPLMLLGSITGAMTSRGALSVINAQSKSTIASIGYTGSYAFANVLLTVAGAVIILM
jgi:putative transport protein